MSVSFPTVTPKWVTTARGEAIALLSQSDLVNVRTQGRHLRAYCPVHGSDHQASLSVNVGNGFGECFCCGVRVLIRELNKEMTERLQRCSTPPTPPLALSRSSSPPPAGPGLDWQAKECQLLHDLSQSGAMRIDRASAWNAQAYLEARGVPVEVARATGVGYLEANAAEQWGEKLLQRWQDRLLFPLLTCASPSQHTVGYAGRLLTGWQSCADEEAHRVFLEQQDLRRWLKTYPAGWFWTPANAPITPLIVVEGPLDRLALLSAGFEAEEVVALVGTALRAEHLPAQVHSLLLALDGDQGGREAALRLERQLHLHQIQVECCLASPSPQFRGKDWSALWRQYGADGLEALYAHHALLSHNL
jgi:DNA primase